MDHNGLDQSIGLKMAAKQSINLQVSEPFSICSTVEDLGTSLDQNVAEHFREILKNGVETDDFRKR